MIDQKILRPDIRLWGEVSDAMLSYFLDRLGGLLDGDEPLVLEVFTPGGDADVARRIALELRLFQEREGREAFFLGKTTVYSAGVTIMAAFPRERRFVTSDCVLLIHERKLEKDVHLSGPLSANLQIAQSLMTQIQIGLSLEKAGFERLIRGSKVSLDEICARAAGNWYVPAEEAHELGLVAGVI